ncbi:MAG: class E sortase [Pseudonocardia sp.]|nr:class E sortase [Pseudonocardia sp.]
MRARVRRRRGGFAWSAAVLALAAAFLVVVPMLAGGDAAPDDAAPIGRADGPPTWDQVLAIRDELRAAALSPDYPVDESQLASIATAPGPYVALGRIAFPTTGLDAEFGAGVHPPVLERGPGHWPGTALPGQPGNSVISGHRTTFTRPFGDLDLLAPGDPIVLTPAGAPAVTYRVVETAIVPEAEYAQFVLRQPTDPTARELTLFACHPKGERTNRIVVRAVIEPIDTPGEGS